MDALKDYALNNVRYWRWCSVGGAKIQEIVWEIHTVVQDIKELLILSGECSALLNWVKHECNSLSNKWSCWDLLNDFSVDPVVCWMGA